MNRHDTRINRRNSAFQAKILLRFELKHDIIFQCVSISGFSTQFAADKPVGRMICVSYFKEDVP